MLVINSEEKLKVGEWVDIEVWGETIRVKVRPRTPKVVDSIKAQFKGMKEGKAKDQAILDALYDHLVEDFEGLGEEGPDGSIELMEVNLENKKRVLFMPVPVDEEPILARLVNKSHELGFQVTEDLKKN